MENPRPHLVTSIENNKKPILIVDKKGFVGVPLAQSLKDQFLTVLVSGRSAKFNENIIHIPYKRSIPVVPDNTYSHMFIVYSGQPEVLDMLPEFMKKAHETGSKVLFITSLEHSSEQLLRRLSHHTYNSLQILLYGEVFDENTTSANMVNLFIYQARRHGRLEIPNEGLGKIYPIYLPDLMAAIIASAFADGFKSKIIFSFPKYPFTEISIARAMQKINPDLKIDFTRRKTWSMNYYIPNDGEHAFHTYDLDSRLKNITFSNAKSETQHSAQKKVNLPTRRINFSTRLIVGCLIGLILAPVLATFLLFGAGIASLSVAVGQAEKGNFRAATYFSKSAKDSLTLAHGISANYFLFGTMPMQKEKLTSGLRVGNQIASEGEEAFYALNNLKNVLKGESKNPSIEFQKSLSTLKNTLLGMQKIKAESQLPKVVNTKLENIGYMVNLLENTIDTYPYVLGFEGKRTYLVLFQNNMELRPGGGFIGSYGLLEIDKGKINKFEIADVYDADGKLKVHIEPPLGLRRYLGASHLFLRDSNFDVDFTVNAQAAVDIYQKETGTKVDGVFAVDTSFIKEIIRALGSVKVDDYNEVVTADNFYLLTQTHAEKNFFPGSTQKKDFLRSLQKSLLAELTTRKDISYTQLIKQIGESIKQKHLLFAFNDPAVQKVFSVNNLSGSLFDARGNEENVLYDYMGIIDANVGANKSNYYLKRSVEQSVVLGDAGSIEETVTVTYENTSKKDSVFGGDYKNYVRFVLPPGASFESLKIDNRAVATTQAITDPAVFTNPTFIRPQELEIEQTERDGKTLIGFYQVVPTSNIKKVSVTYTMPTAINTDTSTFTYDLRIFKQPGTDQDPYVLRFSYPGKVKPIGLGKDFVDVGGKLSFETKITEDKNIKIRFSQK